METAINTPAQTDDNGIKQRKPNISYWAMPCIQPKTKTREEQINNAFVFVEKKFGISRTQIESKSRKSERCCARYVLAYILYNKVKLTLSETGRLIGGRDHSTISHSLDALELIMDEKNGHHLSELVIETIKNYSHEG